MVDVPIHISPSFLLLSRIDEPGVVVVVVRQLVDSDGLKRRAAQTTVLLNTCTLMIISFAVVSLDIGEHSVLYNFKWDID